MSKVPCGGFKLDNNFLGMNENGELSLVSGSEGAPYQQLVTDGTGTAKWEDRLAYEGSRLTIDLREGFQLVKVSDAVPSWASVDVPIKCWLSSGNNQTVTPESFSDLGNGSFVVSEFVFIITTDNFKLNDVVFPEKGVYFTNGSYGYTSGIASADSDTPEITWDGNIETIKTIDPKYIPSELNEIVLPSSTSGSSKKFKITVDDSGTITATQV